jgi:anti-sigma B factor antagonist
MSAQLRIMQRTDSDDAIRVALIGELDLASADAVGACLAGLLGAGDRVRLDLSLLEFIDSSGIRELITAMTVSQRGGGRPEVAPRITDQVARVIDLSGVGPLLWPDGRS